MATHLARVAPEAVDAVLETFSHVVGPTSKPREPKRENLQPKVGMEETVVRKLRALDCVDAVFLRTEADGELTAFISVREHGSAVHDIAYDAEVELSRLANHGVSVRVWAHQGRNVLDSAPPNARLAFRR